MGARFVLVDVTEQLASHTFAPPLVPNAVRDQPEGEEHEEMPFPPCGVPGVAKCDRGHRVTEKDGGNGDGKEHQRGAAQVAPDVNSRGNGVGHHRDCRKCMERKRCSLLG